ncbi:hypothetical protein CcrKarma_gp143 [Caulobacter virus Karma]|uniref:Uncharacterized protein n=6 Tax=Viruses TaxID=10239 RepID=K4JTA6_9CAUD|nr:hypothetical protein D865_gp277 [Caulobacter phage phiCbK]YP_006988821.1 hypothetical protein CcrMagneto_gp139 [Caulobacter virus Magneto]YP_006989523.1 hypothetical protein CcrKarma_gp143 [Caulobacter virus Karma]YP_006989871.1 hypothetical protein D870_gp283 [Caulobacter phage CcrSwift]ARB13667.1 hypothetical protein Ccr10_gp138 [Caulobacter phage Ccr10]ARB14012.1 hypothetical protein Ccr2_gp137 [Caulobacter phage Ccr2]ARB14355.1 hypothetical protein Ccr5_gp136 [Caulobacter phage Ccr5]A
MPDSRPEDQDVGRRNRIHDLIVGDPREDARYARKLSNRDKTMFVCGVLNHPASAFDLDLPFPIEDWIASDDNSLVCAGLYLTDLRLQFYEALAPAQDDEQAFVRQGEAEFWYHRFNVMIERRAHGVLVTDGRVLH